MKKSEFCDLSLEELAQKEIELRKELAVLNLKKRINQISKTDVFKKIKKNIARVLTFRKQKSGSVL